MASSSHDRRPSTARPTPLDLPDFLPYASRQLQAPYTVRVLIEVQEDYVSTTARDKSKKAVRGKSRHAAHASHSRTRTSSQSRAAAEESETRPAPSGEDEILLAAVYDTSACLVELAFLRCGEIPRLLLQILALCVPHQPHLDRLTVRRATLRGTALHEIAKLLPLSGLTDVCLDDSPVAERNYGALLEHERPRLRRLSLARCELGDEEGEAIAAALAHPRPASRTLRTLSLACNALGDAAAGALARALRANRALRHLDLAGNRLTDVGATAIFRSLAEFPLTYDEVTGERRRYMDFLRSRREVYLRCLGELEHAGPTAPEEGARGRRRAPPGGAGGGRGRKASAGVAAAASATDPMSARADRMAAELVGSYAAPFGLEETVSRDGYVHSLGNMALCYLNVAHNELSHVGLAALLETVRYQGALVRKAGPGLLRVTLEGNPLPVACAEYDAVRDLLDRAVLWKISKPLTKVDKTKSKFLTK